MASKQTRNRLRRLNPQQLHQLATTEQDGPTLQLCQQFLADKNTALSAQKHALLEMLTDSRKASAKVVLQLKDSMKEKLRLKEKLVMDSNSRPKADNMKHLTSIYTITEQQNTLCGAKDKQINNLSGQADLSLAYYRSALARQPDYSSLDEDYASLSRQCDAEILVRDNLQAERDRLRRHYAGMRDQIGACRKEYEIVEESIRKAQRELVQLTSYWDQRNREKQKIMQDLRRTADDLEEECLRGQEIVNSGSIKQQSLEVMLREVDGQSALP